jgi:hypothetical protein
MSQDVPTNDDDGDDDVDDVDDDNIIASNNWYIYRTVELHTSTPGPLYGLSDACQP